MRAILVASLILVASVALVVTPVAGAHDVARCDPPFTFPSFAIWNVPAGGTSSFYLPPRYFGFLVASLPVDLAMFRYSDCSPDPTCHHHGIVGPFLCGSTPDAVFEIHNPNAVATPVVLAIGLCLEHTVCDTI